MTKFTYNDIVRVRSEAPPETRPGERAWIVGMTMPEHRSGKFLEQFPEGVVYTIEFEDGSSVEIHEANLDLIETAQPR